MSHPSVLIKTSSSNLFFINQHFFHGMIWRFLKSIIFFCPHPLLFREFGEEATGSHLYHLHESSPGMHTSTSHFSTPLIILRTGFFDGGEGGIIKPFENLMQAIVISSPTSITITCTCEQFQRPGHPLVPLPDPLGRPVIKILSLHTLFKIKMFPKDGLKTFFFKRWLI